MKPRFPGEFHEFVRSDGYDNITLTVQCSDGVYTRRVTCLSQEKVTTLALREFHSLRKEKGHPKCEVTFAAKVSLGDVSPPSSLPDVEIDLDDDW
jgi:hypothetical protein|tara:strand:+ start:257 stop:541 length:285 start_codon:yes stop_codon:yes gene_type:complete